MLEKYLRMQCGTGYCGTDEVSYFKLADQNQTELTGSDYERYTECALSHNESFGYDFQDYCDKNDVNADEDTGEYWDDYVLNCAEAGYIEIVELDPETDTDCFSDGCLETMLW